MYLAINECPIVEPDVDGVGFKLPVWGGRGLRNEFRGEGEARLELDSLGNLMIGEIDTGKIMFGVARSAFIDYARLGTSIYRYSDWIGPLLITIEGTPSLKLSLPRDVFFSHRDRAYALFDNYDRELAEQVKAW